MFPKAASNIYYKKSIGIPINLKHPQTLNEKLMYLKLNTYWNNSLVNQCADKLKVREFVASKGHPDILVDLLGSWDSTDLIEWDKLPARFALKCNHGSGYNIICNDKSKLNKEETAKQMNKWLKQKYGLMNAEQGIYRKIKPFIIAEEFIKTMDGLPPKDYKFFCSYGDVKLIFVASERINGRTKFDYYYPDWTWIPVQNCHPNAGPIQKPDNLNKMIKIASDLSSDFPLVRVDLYNEKGRILFGEMTFTHFGCIHPFEPKDYDYTFGALFPDVTKCKAKINFSFS